MRSLRNFLIGLVLVIAGIAAMLLIPSPQPPASKPWEITLMADGNPRVLGIHLGNTRYGDAQTTLGVFGETALFTDPDGSASVEAYFESINLGGLSAKLVLNLAVPEPLLRQMLTRAKAGKLQPSGAHQYELAEQDRVELLQLPVAAMTYIPSVRLEQDMLESRFGQPSQIQSLADPAGAELWLYPELGLQIQRAPEQKTVLIYQTRPIAAPAAESR